MTTREMPHYPRLKKIPRLLHRERLYAAVIARTQ